MSCPEGQFFSESAKRCLPLKMKPSNKGSSLLPCPEGQVWNPVPNVRKCVRKNIYKMVFGSEKAAAASLEQKKLRSSVKKTVQLRKSKTIKVASLPKGAITPAVHGSVILESSEPRKNSLMPPGLARADMAKWVVTNCKNQEDPIMLEPFADAELRDLKSLVRLGSGFCYPVDILDQHVRASIERDVPVKDMMNPTYRLDSQDFGALKVAATVLKKGYTLPTEPSIKPASHYKFFIGVAGDPDYKLMFLFDDRKVKVLPGGAKEFSSAIPDGGWIGYIPAKGTVQLEKLIKEAFQRGRIFTKATRPFQCCRIHLKKDKAYWSDGWLGKIKAMEEEIQGIL